MLKMILKKLWLYSFLLFLCLNGTEKQLFISHANGENDADLSAHYVFAYLKRVPCLPSSFLQIAPGDPIIFLKADVYDGFINTITVPIDTFTVPEKGAYLISYGASVRYPGVSLELQINGSPVPGGLITFQKECTYTEISIILRLEQGDILSVRNPVHSPPLTLADPAIFPFTDDAVSDNSTKYCASIAIFNVGP